MVPASFSMFYNLYPITDNLYHASRSTTVPTSWRIGSW